MPRDPRKVEKRDIEPDLKYNSILVTKFTQKMMWDGKKTLAFKLLYKALDILAEKTKKKPLDVFEQAIKNVSPVLEVKSRRIGGANYQVPIEVRGNRKLALATKWILTAARARKGMSFDKALAAELLDAYNGTGVAMKRKEDTHKMAEANRAFAHLARY
ncbi:30S ribosomal protein S7 [bacterium CG2_30_37_16]|nr:MAG: 30S ribosomal protein S7 [bacterium CG2_30_37_16]PIP30935.1 MAG: 30S ribosomal protein S7 [bacterium (Candidatus Howlettbacteria) CG23_combo_of_CG06-09_8_20_14_all_37_9]PIX98884.1 MAG: 30S ribosomal protein S7 [bacterium (Candidatus Howlettbacteria) CG_4_10_14_3_um_filter_37_10]PJB07128.1 MAG: 30S ribosomal protein S7 [bacterium (Candidatus Howlettbacteria) CG_4_9_14_3_um_filter_37_10]